MDKKQAPSTDWREYRRLRAWELKQQGWKQKDIAEALGVTPGAVSQWMRRARTGGKEALRRRPAPGRAPRLNAEQRARLPALLAKGAEAYGFRGALWTRKRVAQVIRREFGVSYSPRGTIAESTRLDGPTTGSAGHPTRRSRYPPVGRGRMAADQKKAVDEQRTVVWIDESAFALLAAVVRTYAPRGQTPILDAPLSWDHLSAIGALTLGRRWYMGVQAHAFRRKDIVCFLKRLLRYIPGKLLVVWDQLPAHRRQPIKAFLANGGGARIHLELLPAYAPELNPTEGVGSI